MSIFDDIGEFFGDLFSTPFGSAPPPTSTVYGSGGADSLYGVQNSLSEDTIFGYGGNDYINAYQGNDVIYAGSGNDVIRGGQGFDDMTGGSGFDEFRFATGDSGPSYANADIIRDWDVNSDYINFSGFSGNPNTYFEMSFQGDGTYEGTYNIALSLAEQHIGHFSDGSNYAAFYTDGQDGYLFADNDLNGVVDMGVELRGVTSLDQFNWSDML